MMNIELTRVKVKNGKSSKVDEWLELLNKEMDKVLLTLEAEKMYVETIFREFTESGEFLYWYSIQGDGEHLSMNQTLKSINFISPIGRNVLTKTMNQFI